jgi:hypothetical protein
VQYQRKRSQSDQEIVEGWATIDLRMGETYFVVKDEEGVEEQRMCDLEEGKSEIGVGEEVEEVVLGDHKYEMERGALTKDSRREVHWE